MEFKIVFDNGNNFIYDATKIVVTGGSALLFGAPTTYSTADPLIRCYLPFLASSITSLNATIVAAGGDEVRFVMEIDEVKKYWNGSAWVSSDGSFAQSNTGAQVTANAASLIPANTISSVNVFALLHSASAATTPSVADITIDHDAVVQAVAPTSQVIIYGYIKDASGAPLENVKVKAELYADISEYGSYLISPLVKSTITNSAGYWTLQLADTISMNPANLQYKFTFSGKGLNTEIYKAIPSVATVNFADLN